MRGVARLREPTQAPTVRKTMTGLRTAEPRSAVAVRSLRRDHVGRLRVALSSAGAAVLGVAPHVLHHAGPLAGAAIFAGVGGSLLFGALGLLAAVPLLMRMRRRSGGWRRPLALLGVFAAVFSVSTFVIGPALTSADGDRASEPQGPAGQAVPDKQAPGGHEQHH